MFRVAAEAYDSFMGRYSVPLATPFCDFANVAGENLVLDVGCGPGALTGELVRRLGAGSVAAIDPSEPFVAAVGERHPGVDIRLAPAEDIPFPDDTFDASLAELVVHFMADPVAGLSEMARATRRGGVVAACVWDSAPDGGPLSRFWQLTQELDPDAEDESGYAGTREGHLVELFNEAGLRDIEGADLSVAVEHASFEDWWRPFTMGVGPPGAYIASLDEKRRAALEQHVRAGHPDGRFVVTARAWAARGRT
jgi:ubiquinone/menaquinone biosynthesis C-methylase UbiE